MGTLRQRVFRFLPPLIAVGTLVYLFAFHIELDNQSQSARALSVDSTAQMITLETAEGERRIPFANVTELKAPDGVYNHQPEAAVNTQVTYTRFGLLHYLNTIGLAYVLIIGAVIFIAICIQALRLHLLLLGTQHAYFTTLKAMFVGLFYGNVIPAGQVGGDPIKALYLSTWTGQSRSSTLAAVTLDRIVGLAVLALVAAIALAFVVDTTSSTSIAVFALLGGLSLGLALLLSRRTRKALGVSWLGKRMPFKDSIIGYVDALSMYKQAPQRLVAAVLLSVFSHSCIVGAVVIVGHAIGLHELTLGHYGLLVPLTAIVGSIPGSPPGGWGVGEGAYVIFFSVYGVPPEAAITLSIVPRTWIVLISLLGFPSATFTKRASVKKSSENGHKEAE